PRKMFFQFLPCFQDSVYDPLFKISLFESTLDKGLGAFPEILGDCPVYSPIAIYDEFFIAYGNIEQYPIFFLGVVHFQKMEHLLGAFKMANMGVRFYMDPNFT